MNATTVAEILPSQCFSSRWPMRRAKSLKPITPPAPSLNAGLPTAMCAWSSWKPAALTLQGMHRIRSLWMGTRTSRINALRGFCWEFGIAIPGGATATCACRSPMGPGACCERGQRCLWRAPLGSGCTGAHQSQQGGLRSCQQAGAHWLCHAQGQGAVCRQRTREQKNQQGELCDAGVDLSARRPETAVTREENLSSKLCSLRRD